jgi:predicted enzyme related to lactoylglutathione lyase
VLLGVGDFWQGLRAQPYRAFPHRSALYASKATHPAARTHKEIDMSGGIPRRKSFFPQGLSALLWSAICISAVRAAPFELPPLNTPRSTEHHVGKVVWADLVTPDLAAAERFYGGLFGWTFQIIHTGDSQYAVALVDGRPVGGLFQKPIRSGEHRQPAWLTFIAVRDLDAAKRLALAHGAKVVSDSKDYPLRGRQAVMSDPDGAVFAMLASSSGDAPDFLAAPGEWIWSSLLCKHPGPEAAFYQQVFSYDVFDLASDDNSEHLILSSDDFARVGVNPLPGDSKPRYPHWLNFIRVDNTADMVAKVVAAGGRVLVEPRLDRHGGQVALVADPAGAPFGLMEWTESDSKVEPK